MTWISAYIVLAIVALYIFLAMYVLCRTLAMRLLEALSNRSSRFRTMAARGVHF